MSLESVNTDVVKLIIGLSLTLGLLSVFVTPVGELPGCDLGCMFAVVAAVFGPFLIFWAFVSPLEAVLLQAALYVIFAVIYSYFTREQNAPIV